MNLGISFTRMLVIRHLQERITKLARRKSGRRKISDHLKISDQQINSLKKHIRHLKISDQQSTGKNHEAKLRSFVNDKTSRRLSDQPSIATNNPKSRTSSEQHISHSNVTYRPKSSQSHSSDMEAQVDDIIPPYNALKIDALNEYEIENEEEDIADANMEDPIAGNELALMEEDDLLGEDLENMTVPELTDPNQNMQDNSMLMIEASNNS